MSKVAGGFSVKRHILHVGLLSMLQKRTNNHIIERGQNIYENTAIWKYSMAML